MPYSMGCLFVEAYEVSSSKEFGNAQSAGTVIDYGGSGTATWSAPNAVLDDQNGNNLGVGSGTLTPGVSEILCKLTRRVTNRSHSWNHSQQIKIQEERKATVS